MGKKLDYHSNQTFIHVLAGTQKINVPRDGGKAARKTFLLHKFLRTN